MNIHRLKYFVSLAENLNFTKAAEECFIAQAAMSRQIAALEQELNVNLFKRNTRSVELTEAGQDFYWRARKILADYALAVESVQNIATQGDYILHLGVGPYESELIFPVLQEFMRRHPTALVDCRQHSYEHLAKHASGGMFDMVFCIDHCANRIKDHCSFVIHDLPFDLICSKKNPLTQKEEPTHQDLNGQVLITMSEYNFTEFKASTETCFTPSAYLYVNTFETKLLLTRSNVGVAWLPTFMRPTLPPDVRAYPGLSNSPRAFCGAFHPDKLVNPALREFLQILAETFDLTELAEMLK